MRQVIIKRIILKMEIFFSNDFYEKKQFFSRFFSFFDLPNHFWNFYFLFFIFGLLTLININIDKKYGESLRMEINL